MSKNDNLRAAKKAKNDEFYTQMKDIENELQHYIEHFKDKIIYCNCDTPVSNFYKFFKDNFEQLGIKKVVATGLGGYYADYDGVNERKVKIKDWDGDFRSDLAVEILQKADIIITNPPFSLFREYIDLLVRYDKKFLILGNQNAITYKEVFPLIKDGQIWLGKNCNKTMTFRLPDYYEKFKEIKNGQKYGDVPAISWFTNLDNYKYEEPIALTAEYSSDKYPEYDNYDAINVDKIKEIPYDYDGVIGVPITIINNVANDGLIHCENLDLGEEIKFEILDCNDYRKEHMNIKNQMLVKDKDSAINGQPIYARVLIQKV